MVTIILSTILTMVNINNKVTVAILITASFNPLNCQFFTQFMPRRPVAFRFQHRAAALSLAPLPSKGLTPRSPRGR